MALTGERAAAALRALDLGEVDSITELDTRGDEGWEGIVGPIRNEVANAYAEGRFDSDADEVIREIGSGLVPSMTRQIIEELLIVGAAYDHETEADCTGQPLCQIIGYTLSEVYADAAQALVEWVGEQDDPEDDEDTRSGNCTRCGLLLHWDADSGSFRDDAEDEFCENGLQHERADD